MHTFLSKTQKTKRQIFVGVLYLCAFIVPAIAQATEVYDLRVEYKKNPIGLDTKLPRLSWKISSDVAGQEQTAYQILVASDPKMLSPQKADLWNSQKIVSSQSIQVNYAGSELGFRQKCWWSVRIWDKNGKATKWSPPARFEIGPLTPEDWTAIWIKTAIEFDEYSYPSPFLRKEFTLNKPIKSARLYCSGKGLYEFYINGEKAGDQVFTPGYTSFQKRLQYQVYDITSTLKRGANAMSVILGNGWYRAFNPNNVPMPDIQDLEIIAQLEVEYSDGSKEVINTDNTWKSTTGPIIKSEIFDGEIYDARLELTGWNFSGYDDSEWQGVRETPSGKDNLVGSVSEPVRKVEEINPVGVIRTPEGDIVVDMGQNMVGWCRLKVEAPAGTTIRLRHAEVLDQKGNFYTANLRSAKQEIVYTCKGGGTEIYEPRFTFQGFRYVAVSGYPGEVTTDLITGIVIHSDLDVIGSFRCNDELINQLQHNILWAQRGNFLDIPTDCPQRNERIGWTGDAQVFAPTACYNMHSAAFFTKWLKDLAADQHSDGQVPHVVPDDFGRVGAVGWADAALIVPWNVYLSYGDHRILEEQYASMKGWVDYMRLNIDSHQLWRPSTRYRQYGDWLSFATTQSDYPGAFTSIDLLANAYYYHSTGILARSAQILGYTQDAKEYSDLQEKIKEAFNKEFVTPNGRLSSDTQTAYVVALSFGLIPSHLEQIAAQRLADDVNRFGHITTGFLGTADICHVLTRYGYIREAYKLLNRKEYPSWLYPVTKGATTIWERWDGIKPDGSFQDPSMNSYNHYAYGAIGDWLYKVVAGINPDPEQPGYKQITIKPHPFGEMNNVRATHESPYGEIASEWSIENGILKMKVIIPVNAKADIFIPSTEQALKENGRTITGFETVEGKNLPYQFLQLTKGSGIYVFETTLNIQSAVF